jgi:glutathionylspermidine synthase
MTIEKKNEKEKKHYKISHTEYEKLKYVSEYIYNIANETLLDVICKQNIDIEWIKSRYNIVKDLWYGKNDGINLMRIDFAWDLKGNLKVLELNTSSQGGWLMRDKILYHDSIKDIGIPLTPDPMFYINYLIKKLGKKILFITITHNYNKDLDIIIKNIKELGYNAKIIQISNIDIKEIIDFNPTGIFWKCQSVLVENSELITNISKLNLPQIPSFESLFISGDKCFLSILNEKDKINVIPKTYVLDKKDIEKNINLITKDNSVLKPGDLARGNGVIFGKNCNDNIWKKNIQNAMNSDNEWVIQELCYLKKNENNEYHDIVVFIENGNIKGIGSRVSEDEIINVHKNGSSQPVILTQ